MRSHYAQGGKAYDGYMGALDREAMTPKLGGHDASKGLEVNAWLAKHPEIADWLIIDDRATVLPEQESRHVRPVYAEGLSWANFKQAAKILHGVDNLPE